MSLNTTPITWVAGNVVTAAQLNTEVRDVATGIQAAWTVDGRASSTIWTAATTNPTLGNGTLSSRYLRIGKTLDWQVVITMGSTTTFGSGFWLLTLPFTALAANTGDWQGRALDVSTSTTQGVSLTADLTSTTQLAPRCAPATPLSIDRIVNSTQPFTWATGDILSMTGRIELA